MKINVIDTNVLLRAIQRQNLNLRSLAREAIKKLYRQGDSLCVCPRNLIELWNVSTRPANVNGLGLGIPGTQKNISRCETFFVYSQRPLNSFRSGSTWYHCTKSPVSRFTTLGL